MYINIYNDRRKFMIFHRGNFIFQMKTEKQKTKWKKKKIDGETKWLHAGEGYTHGIICERPLTERESERKTSFWQLPMKKVFVVT